MRSDTDEKQRKVKALSDMQLLRPHCGPSTPASVASRLQNRAPLLGNPGVGEGWRGAHTAYRCVALLRVQVLLIFVIELVKNRGDHR